MKPISTPSSGLMDRRMVQALELLLIGAAALLTRLVLLDQPQHVDEFNHVLAARSLLADGTLIIEGGSEPYTRGRLYTYLVAGAFLLFGDESLATARIPSMLAGVALVIVVFAWVRSVAGPLAAWIAGLLVCFSPLALSWSPIARFYSLQALLFFCGAVLIYHVVSTREFRRTHLYAGGGATLCLLLALELQILTAVGIIGVALWAALARGPEAFRWWLANPHRVPIGGAVALLAALLLAAVLLSGFVADTWALFRYADLWALENRGNVRFYHWRLLEQYPTLWTLFPFLLLVALFRRQRAALFCGTVFLVAFAFHSFAAWKTMRYLIYALPFFLALSGIVTAGLIGVAHRRVRGALAARKAAPRLSPRVAAGVSAAALTVAMLFTAFSNSAVMQSLNIVTGRSASVATWGATRWEMAAPLLRPTADTTSVLVSSSELAPLYYLNRLDVGLSRSRQNTFEQGSMPEFTRHWKTGYPQISMAESLGRVMECYPDGLVLVELSHWNVETAVPENVTALLMERADSIALPPELNLVAYQWEGGERRPPADCLPVPL